MSQRHPVQNEALMLITTNTKDRRKLFGNDAHAREAIEIVYRVQELHPFFLYAFVIMPDHCHLLMNVFVPETISTVMNRFKMGVSHSIGLGPLWQPRFHMRIPKGSWEARRYIHMNPVKAGLVENPEDYPWSSASGKWDVTEFECW